MLLSISNVAVFAEIKYVAYQAKLTIGRSLKDSERPSSKIGSPFYQSLVAELYNQLGEPKLTLDYYLPLALKSNDVNLVKRATEIATGSAQLKKGLTIAKHWVELSPKDIEARQYLTLLLLRDKQLIESSKQLPFVRNIIEESEGVQKTPILISKGLKFIGALLVGEAHHNKAYKVYEIYIKEHGQELYNGQQNLILASLAMSAKKYSAVVSAIENIKEGDTLYKANVGLMKSKALQKLGRYEEAAQLIKSIVNTEETSDSLRLELSRLLIRVGEKKEASKLLESLIERHPDNNDLLKSLIALEINQQHWNKAKVHNDELNKTDAYQSDASYFYGEINEAEGNLKKALGFFKDVNDGSFVKSSHRKTAFLIARINSVKDAREWLRENRKKSNKKRDKAHWLQLEAELLAEVKPTKQNLNKAVKIYSEIISLLPNKVRYYYHRGLTYERINQVALAEEDFKQVLKKRKKDADTLNALGFLLLKHTTRFEEAKKYIKQAYKLKPNDPTIMDSLGWVYFQSGENKQAEIYLRKAFQFSQNQEIANHLITVLIKTGQVHEASVIKARINKKP